MDEQTDKEWTMPYSALYLKDNLYPKSWAKQFTLRAEAAVTELGQVQL